MSLIFMIEQDFFSFKSKEKTGKYRIIDNVTNDGFLNQISMIHDKVKK